MTQAVNLANFANYLDTSGGLSPNALNAATPVSKGGTGATSLTNGAILKGNGGSAVSAASGTDIATALGSTAVQNSTNSANLKTTNFSIVETVDGLVFKYGTTTIGKLDSSGNFSVTGNITAYGV